MGAYIVGWPRGLKWPEAARLPKLWVRTPPGAWLSVSFECCVLSGRECGVSERDLENLEKEVA